MPFPIFASGLTFASYNDKIGLPHVSVPQAYFCEVSYEDIDLR